MVSDPSHVNGSVERLRLFSDAVVAIAITLLALELPVPHGDTGHQFWHSVRVDDGHYAAFLISFLVIAGAWTQHHRLFDAVEDTDGPITKLNFLWLFTIVVTPFATRLLTDSDGGSKAVHAFQFGFYALVETVSSIAMLGIIEYVVRRSPHLVVPQAQMFSAARWGNIRVIVGFGLSVPVFFVWRSAWALWFAAPLLIRLVREVAGLCRRGSSAA
jgi:uncharacterized membrane protein